jgi:hypothetical protein
MTTNSLLWFLVEHMNSGSTERGSRSKGGSTGDKGNESNSELHVDLLVMVVQTIQKEFMTATALEESLSNTECFQRSAWCFATDVRTTIRQKSVNDSPREK